MSNVNPVTLLYVVVVSNMFGAVQSGVARQTNEENLGPLLNVRGRRDAVALCSGYPSKDPE